MREGEFNASNLSWIFHEVIESSHHALGEAVSRIMAIVRAMPCAQESLEDVTLALEEALANAIIHGNRGDPSKKVEIFGACEDHEKLLLVITDEGEGFDPPAIPDPTLAENIYSTGGRGIFLMNRLMDQMEFRKGGRQIVLRKRVAKGGI